MKSITRLADSLGRAATGFAAAARIGAVGALAAWPVLLGRSLFYVVCLIVLSAFWDRVAADHVRGALALPAGGLALYVGATEWITLAVPAIQLRLEDDIRLGGLESHLLRPKLYLPQRIAESLGALIARLAVTGAVALGLLAVSGRAAPPPAGLAMLAVLGVLGGLVAILLYTLAGLSAFWVRKTLPAMLIIQKLIFLLGGLFAPVSLYSGWLRALAESSPFAAGLYWPAQQVIDPSAAGFWRALGWQALWIAILAALTGLIWRQGLRRVLREGL